jgi:hypothetical protein
VFPGTIPREAGISVIYLVGLAVCDTCHEFNQRKLAKEESVMESFLD